MSEVSKSLKRLLEIEVAIDNDFYNSTQLVSNLHTELQNLTIRANHFMTKLDMKDPVTGQPIYGQNMKTKISELDQKLQHLLSRCEYLSATVVDVIPIIESEKNDNNASDYNSVITSSLSDVTNSVTDVVPNNNVLDLHELNVRAEEIRLQKHRKLEEEKQKHAMVI
jgi:hypothetical protein